MRHNYDVIVVGGGLSGLMAAAVAAENGKKTALLTKGAGTLTIGGGVIDFLGYIDGKPVKEPAAAVDSLPESHPYRIIGKENVLAALAYFYKCTVAHGFAYKAHDGSNCYLPTAVGTLKPTYFAPQTSDPELLMQAESITVVGIKGLKDFYPELLISGLKKRKAYANKELHPLILEPPFSGGRDLSSLDVARYVTSEEGFEWLAGNLRSYKGSTVIIPPVLGTKPSTEVFDMLKSILDIKCFETPVMPPSVPGLRLRQIFMEKIKSHRVDMIELGEVSRASVDGRRCSAVYTVAADGERRYTADKFVIATGGFFGGGCIAEPGKAYEAIFGIDLGAPDDQMSWSQYSLLGKEPHLFASMGVRVNERLNPIDSGGQVLLENVHFAGRTLGGYDFAVEKSGNGVALATGYLAGRI